ALETSMAELEEYVRTQPTNVDETSCREAGRRAWLWVVVTPLVTIFHVAATRCGKVAKHLLGPARGQVVTSDCWKAYNIGKRLIELSDRVFAWWHRVRDGTLCCSSFQVYVSGLRGELFEALEDGEAWGCSKTAATCRELIAHERKLWAF